MKKISVPESILPRIRKIVEENAIDIEIQTEDGDLSIQDTGTERLQSNLSTLFCGGWIACETARVIAKKLNIPLSQMGMLLNHLNIKVRRCGLGCF